MAGYLDDILLKNVQRHLLERDKGTFLSLLVELGFLINQEK